MTRNKDKFMCVVYTYVSLFALGLCYLCFAAWRNADAPGGAQLSYDTQPGAIYRSGMLKE